MSALLILIVVLAIALVAGDRVAVVLAQNEIGRRIAAVAVQPAAGGPEVPLALLRGALTFAVPLQQLPFGAQLTAITPGVDGLHVTAVAAPIWPVPEIRWARVSGSSGRSSPVRASWWTSAPSPRWRSG